MVIQRLTEFPVFVELEISLSCLHKPAIELIQPIRRIQGLFLQSVRLIYVYVSQVISLAFSQKSVISCFIEAY
jgi:hypothetical protein